MGHLITLELIDVQDFGNLSAVGLLGLQPSGAYVAGVVTIRQDRGEAPGRDSGRRRRRA